MIIFDKEVDDLLVARWAEAYAIKYPSTAVTAEEKLANLIQNVFQTIENNVLSVELPLATKAAIQAEEDRIKGEIKADKAEIAIEVLP